VVFWFTRISCGRVDGGEQGFGGEKCLRLLGRLPQYQPPQPWIHQTWYKSLFQYSTDMLTILNVTNGTQRDALNICDIFSEQDHAWPERRYVWWGEVTRREHEWCFGFWWKERNSVRWINFVQSSLYNLTFRGPWIVIYIYAYNNSQQNALFLNFILVKNSTCFGQIYCPASAVSKTFCLPGYYTKI